VFTESLSVVLPFYNASTQLETAIPTLLAALQSACAHFELILVDDGSTDTGGRVAEQFAAAHDPVMILHHRHRWGYGLSLQDGWLAAHGTVILALDLDSVASLPELPQLLAYSSAYPLVLGYRRHRSTALVPDAHFTRMLTGIELYDPAYRFALLRPARLDQAFISTPNDWIIAELAVHCARQGQPFVQVALDHYKNPSGLIPAARLFAPYRVARAVRLSEDERDPYRLRNTTAHTLLVTALGVTAFAGGLWLARRSQTKP
jgi:glycosyltransferase involved in cell wall biosynthesis